MAVTVGARCWCWLVLVLLMVLLECREAESTPSVIMCDGIDMSRRASTSLARLQLLD